MQNNANIADLPPVLAPMGEHNTTERAPLCTVASSSFIFSEHGCTDSDISASWSVHRSSSRMPITCSIVLQTYCNIILVLHLIGHLFLLVSSVTSLITCSCWPLVHLATSLVACYLDRFNKIYKSDSMCDG